MRGAGAVIVLLAVLLVTGSVAAGDDPRLPLAEVGWRAAWSMAVDPVMTPHDDTPIAAVSAHGLVVATRQRTVEIRDPRTGAVRRVVAAPREPTGLGAAAGMLVMATKAPSPAHPSLHGYKLADGEHVWKQTITDAVKNEGPPIMVTEHAVVVVGREKKGTVPVRSIDVRDGRTLARVVRPVGCRPSSQGATTRLIVFAEQCPDGVRVTAMDPNTLRQVWTRPLTSLRRPGGDADDADTSPGVELQVSAEGTTQVWVAGDDLGFTDDYVFTFTQDGQLLPALSARPTLDSPLDRWSQPLQRLEFGEPPAPAAELEGFDSARPLPAYLTSIESGSGRLGAFPLDIPASSGQLLGTAGDLAFVYVKDENSGHITAYRRVRGHLPGPAALGGVDPAAWPDACTLLTAHDLRIVADGYRPVPYRWALGDLTWPKPATCDWIPPTDSGAVVSVSVAWVARSSAEARALFDAAVSELRRDCDDIDDVGCDYDPVADGDGLFSAMPDVYSVGRRGNTLVNVGPVIAELNTDSPSVLRLLGPRIRANLGGSGRGRPVHGSGWSHVTDSWLSDAPVVDGGVVYVMGADREGGRYTFYALEEATGRPRWTVPTSVWSFFAVADGVVYGTAEERTCAIDATTGRERWRYQMPSNDDAVLGRDHVYVFGENGVVALDKATGRQRWRYQERGNEEIGTLSEVGGLLYASGGGGVVALDRMSGKVRWHRARLGGRAMAVNKRAVYAGDGDGYAYALDPATGRTRWRTRLSGSIGSVVIAAGGTVYVTGEGRTYALDATMGKRRWSFLGEPVQEDSGRVAATQDLAYILGPDERLLHALDSASGVQRWSRALPDALSTEVVIHGEAGYVGDEEGVLHAFDAVTGTDRWSFRTGARRIMVGPVVAGDHIYVGGSNGILFALSPADGTAG
ncbi:PQQ-binding-like beta-propeller repeat protein [Nonomuraea fuscirosea]|uniref:outer membrane protein assembly factor BamB family protein n=1 Tax=Nonomuraea fuscirosea TaxID=1291556 RepID=UPI00378758BD